METWKSYILPAKVARYDPNDIFNINEFGLFYTMLPNSLVLKDETCRGAKHSSDLLTVTREELWMPRWKKKSNIILFIDHCPAYPKELIN
jgi:hypothetical protein